MTLKPRRRGSCCCRSWIEFRSLSAILFSAIGNLTPASQTAIQQADQSVQASAQVVQMEKTVVTARRLAPELQLAAVAAP